MESSTVILISKDPGLIETTKQWAEEQSLKVQVYSPNEWEGLNQSISSIQKEPTCSQNVKTREAEENCLSSSSVLPFSVDRFSSPDIITDSSKASTTEKTTLEGPSSSERKVKTMNELENKAIQEAIHEFNGNLTEAAKALGIGRATLYRKVKQYQIDLRTTRQRRLAA